MATQLHNTGEEFIIDYVFTDGAVKPASLSIGLYNDATDALTDTDDLAAITTEPNTGNYARQSVTFDSSGFSSSLSGGDWRATNDSTVSFDVTNTSETVDSYFVIVNFTSDDAGDASATDHLFWTGDLEQSRDLSQIDTLDVNTIGVSLT